MLMRLDLETRPHHAAVEAAWRDLLVDDVSDADYAAQLARVYGFEGPLEAALAYTPDITPIIEVKRRMCAGLLAQDLLALDLPPAQIANLPGIAIAPFVDVADALGWMYVLERATPLHGVVREHLIAMLPRLRGATSYLSACETSIGSRWLELGAALDRVAERPGAVARTAPTCGGADGDAEVTAVDRIVLAAFDAFRCAIDWYQRQPGMRRVG
jgi:heme oxygenase